jgi:hypothetical protein
VPHGALRVNELAVDEERHLVRVLRSCAHGTSATLFGKHKFEGRERERERKHTKRIGGRKQQINKQSGNETEGEVA